jgi:hypothetical protein
MSYPTCTRLSIELGISWWDIWHSKGIQTRLYCAIFQFKCPFITQFVRAYDIMFLTSSLLPLDQRNCEGREDRAGTLVVKVALGTVELVHFGQVMWNGPSEI